MCAIVGVFNVKHASKIAYYALFAMQHRGQEATGISASDGKKIRTTKSKGLGFCYGLSDKIETIISNQIETN